MTLVAAKIESAVRRKITSNTGVLALENYARTLRGQDWQPWTMRAASAAVEMNKKKSGADGRDEREWRTNAWTIGVCVCRCRRGARARTGAPAGGVSPMRSKGNRVNIPEPGGGDRAFGPQRGNATELGDASVDPGKSSLFFVRSGLPGIGLSRDRDVASVKRRASRGVRCVGVGP